MASGEVTQAGMRDAGTGGQDKGRSFSPEGFQAKLASAALVAQPRGPRQDAGTRQGLWTEMRVTAGGCAWHRPSPCMPASVSPSVKWGNPQIQPKLK